MNLVERVKNIIVTPKTEWPVIAEETTSIADIYKSYIIILAAIGPVASLVGSSLFARGLGIPFILVTALLMYVIGLALVYVMAFIIDALAPSFSGQKSMDQAFKVATYAATPGWVAGIFSIIPGLGGLIMFAAGIYGWYLLYLGLPVLMKAPSDKALTYTIVVIVVSIVATVVCMMVPAFIAAMFFVSAAPTIIIR
jgi:hypothetical protein